MHTFKSDADDELIGNWQKTDQQWKRFEKDMFYLRTYNLNKKLSLRDTHFDNGNRVD